MFKYLTQHDSTLKTMPCFAIENLIPVVDPTAFVHPTAVLIGDVIIGPNCYVGANAVLRGDFGRIAMHTGSNLQDNCVMHSFPGQDCIIEADGHVGHGAILHGCTVGKNALVGMQSVVMDGATIGANSFVAACSFVKAGFEGAEQVLLIGNPATVKRPLSDDEVAWKRRGTGEYQTLTERSLQSHRIVQPLTAEQTDRPRFTASNHTPKKS